MKNSTLSIFSGCLGLICLWGIFSSSALPPIIIKGKIKNAGNKLIVYIPTVNGIYTTLSKDTVCLQSDSTFTITLPSDSPEKVTFILWGKHSLGSVYAQPGVTEIEIDASIENDLQTQQGSKRENEALKKLTKIDRDVWALRAREADAFQVKKDTVAMSVYHKLLTYAQQQESQLKGVNKVFKSKAIQDIRMQLLLVFSNQYLGISHTATAETQKEWNETLLKMAEYVKLNHPDNVWSSAFLDANRNYSGIQLLVQHPDRKSRTPNEYNRMFFDGYTRTLKGKVLEAALANLIFEDYQDKRLSTEIPELCKQFNVLFPQSALTNYMDRVLVENIAFNQPTVLEEIHFMDVAKMSSLKEITDCFPGKVIFLDLWATWCGPCRESFATVKPLQKYAQENNVILLYITIDRPTNAELWKKMAAYYNLKGEHAMVNKAINQDIHRLFGKNDLLAIPHCAIINKKGEIQFKSAESPEEMEKLIVQLKEAAK